MRNVRWIDCVIAQLHDYTTARLHDFLSGFNFWFLSFCNFDALYSRKMKYLPVFTIVMLSLCTACEKEHKGIRINPEDSLLFNGYFVTSAYYGAVTLFINNGCYEFNNSLPNGHGAGKLLAKEDILEFRDTLNLPILHVYGYAFVPRGNHYYKYDGKKLEIQRYINGGKIMYELLLETPAP
jgi:hypothetical protein